MTCSGSPGLIAGNPASSGTVCDAIVRDRRSCRPRDSRLLTVPIGLLLFVAWFVLTIVAAIKANEGVAYRYPFALRLVK